MEVIVNKEEKYDYWLDYAEYDIKTAEAMLNSGRYLCCFYVSTVIRKVSQGAL